MQIIKAAMKIQKSFNFSIFSCGAARRMFDIFHAEFFVLKE